MLETSLIILAILFFVLVGFIVFAFISANLGIKKSLNILAGKNCPSCNNTFGIECAKKSNVDHEESNRKITLEHPNMRINFKRSWSVICPSCGYCGEFNIEYNLLNEET